jgi:hypothetical protein
LTIKYLERIKSIIFSSIDEFALQLNNSAFDLLYLLK